MSMPKETIAGIYVVRLLDGREYIGSSINLQSRWKSHKADLRGGKHHCRLLQEGYAAVGDAGVSFHILEVVDYIGDLSAREQAWIDERKPELNTHIYVGRSSGARKFAIRRREEDEIKHIRDDVDVQHYTMAELNARAKLMLTAMRICAKNTKDVRQRAMIVALNNLWWFMLGDCRRDIEYFRNVMTSKIVRDIENFVNLVAQEIVSKRKAERNERNERKCQEGVA